MTSRSASLAAPIAVALLIGLTGCAPSATAPSASAPFAAGSRSSATTGTAASPSAAAARGPVDACKLVPLATVSKIMGVTYATAASRPQGGDSSECDYDTRTSTLQHLTLMIQLTGGKEESQVDQQAIVFMGEKPIVLSGVGDSAYEAPEDSDARIEKAYGALWGDTYVTVGGPIEISEDQGKQLLTAAHDAL